MNTADTMLLYHEGVSSVCSQAIEGFQEEMGCKFHHRYKGSIDSARKRCCPWRSKAIKRKPKAKTSYGGPTHAE